MTTCGMMVIAFIICCFADGWLHTQSDALIDMYYPEDYTISYPTSSLIANDTGIRRYVPESKDENNTTDAPSTYKIEPLAPVEPSAPVDIEKLMPLKPHNH